MLIIHSQRHDKRARFQERSSCCFCRNFQNPIKNVTVNILGILGTRFGIFFLASLHFRRASSEVATSVLEGIPQMFSFFCDSHVFIQRFHSRQMDTKKTYGNPVKMGICLTRVRKNCDMFSDHKPLKQAEVIKEL